MVAPLALLPSLIYLPWLLVQWLRRRAAAARGERLAASMTAARLDPEEQPMTDRGATKSQLAAANRAAAGVKLRVSGALFQLGWALFFFEVFHGIIWGIIDGGGSMVKTGMRAVLGGGWMHICLMTAAMPIMLLAARPDMARAIRVVCITLFGLFCGFALFFIFVFARILLTRWEMIAIANLVGFICMTAAAGTLVKTLYCSCCCGSARVMPPRAALQRAWIAIRILFFASTPLRWPDSSGAA